jgi:hypothetical protein
VRFLFQAEIDDVKRDDQRSISSDAFVTPTSSGMHTLPTFASTGRWIKDALVGVFCDEDNRVDCARGVNLKNSGSMAIVANTDFPLSLD